MAAISKVIQASYSVIAMKIDTHRHSGEGRNPGVGRWTPAFAGVTVGRPTVIFIPLRGLHKDTGDSGVGWKPPPAPLDSGLRRSDGGEAASIFIPLRGLGKGMRNCHEI